MIGKHRLRRYVPLLVTAALAMAIVACTATGQYPNTTFEPKTDLGRAIDGLWDRLLLLGTIVFVLVEAALLFVVWKYRQRPGQPDPKQIHGSTSLELLWTLIPAVVLVFIAVPTVRVIFDTQAPAPRDALRIEVIGHQWWWEFRYPEQNIITANELFLPIGRTVSFELRTRDVLHSFWIPQLGAKRDLISNRSNYITFTSDSVPGGVWNGFCTEYCGASHANMHFRVFTVSPEEFEAWVAWQQSPAAGTGGPAPGAVPAGEQTAAAVQQALGAVPGGVAAGTTLAPGQQMAGPQQPLRSLDTGPGAPVAPPAGTQPSPVPPLDTQPAAVARAQFAGEYVFPHERIPDYAIPKVPLPRVAFQDNLVGDPARGEQIYSSVACIGCHTVRGNRMSMGTIGPDLTHFGSRTTLGAGMYPNDTRHLVRWIKNAPRLKPGSLMPALGTGEYDPRMRTTVTMGGLNDQQIADIAAYLHSLR